MPLSADSRVALTLDGGGQRTFMQRARSQLGHHCPRLGKVFPCGGADELDVSLGRRGVAVQFRFDGLRQRDNAGESLCQRVVDLPCQPLALRRHTGLRESRARLGPAGAASSATSPASLARCRSDLTITVPITGAATTPTSVSATATGMFGQAVPCTASASSSGVTVTVIDTTSAAGSGNVAKSRGYIAGIAATAAGAAHNPRTNSPTTKQTNATAGQVNFFVPITRRPNVRVHTMMPVSARWPGACCRGHDR